MSGPSARRGWLWGLAIAVGVVVVAGLAVASWIVFGPGPTDFAGRDRTALAAYGGHDPTGAPKELAQASLIERGRYLAEAADCAACHTAKGGEPFAGGYPFVLPFGTLYSTNITPDKETGIGDYSDADFLNAVQRGVARGGKRLYPAMPYASYTYMTDSDALAIKAYLFSLPPVAVANRADTLMFPFNQRWSMAVWALLFDPDRRFEPHTQRSDEWNRGAYLVEALGHCGECHTPRNLAQALDNRSKFTGVVQAGWRAYNITSAPVSGVGGWSDDDIGRYLADGHAKAHGTASGPMGEAVDNSLRYLTPDDIKAMVVYLRTVPAQESPDLPIPKEQPAPPRFRDSQADEADALGRRVYEKACASCHGWSGVSLLSQLATLTGARAVNDPQARNVAQIVLSGSQHQGGLSMPAFGAAYSDDEIAAVVNYVTKRFGASPSKITPDDIAKLRGQ